MSISGSATEESWNRDGSFFVRGVNKHQSVRQYTDKVQTEMISGCPKILEWESEETSARWTSTRPPLIQPIKVEIMMAKKSDIANHCRMRRVQCCTERYQVDQFPKTSIVNCIYETFIIVIISHHGEKQSISTTFHSRQKFQANF